MRTYCKALKSDSEHFSFNTVLHPFLLLCKDFIEGLLEGLAIEIVIYRYILASVMHPDVHDTWVVLSLTHCVCDVAAALCVLYPELADALVRI